MAYAGSRCRQNVCRNDIVNIREIPGLFSGSKYRRRLIVQNAMDEFWDNNRILVIQGLFRPENIKISEAYGFYVEKFGENPAIIFAGQFAEGIRRNEQGQRVFSLRENSRVPVNGTGGSKDKSFDIIF